MRYFLLTPELESAINAHNASSPDKIIVCDHGNGPCIDETILEVPGLAAFYYLFEEEL